MSYTICSRFKGEHIVYAGYTICTSREHIVYGAFCGSTMLTSVASILIDFLMACDCWCSVALPYCAMGWSAVCDSL